MKHNRDAVYRIRKAEGLNRLPPSEQTRKLHATFKDYEVGFVPIDVKHRPNRRRQRVLKGLSPEMVLRQRLEAHPSLANPTYRPPSPSLINRALRSGAHAKQVSHPDS